MWVSPCVCFLLALLPALAHGSASEVANATTTTVTTASQLNTALANNAIQSIIISKTITINSTSWASVTINRSVAISGASAHATLSFSQSSQPLLLVAPSVSLRIQALIVKDFLPDGACNGSQQQQAPGGPAPAISSTGGSVTWADVVFYSREDVAALR
jgi:hypothetical protein